MDPTQCMAELRAALTDRDWTTVADRADDLIWWLDMGGYPPSGLTQNGARAFIASVWERVEAVQDSRRED